MTATLAFILPEIPYDNGFLIDGTPRPYYSFCSSNQAAHWSDEMDDFISETSKDHFIDRYNRKIVREALRPKLQTPGAVYMDIGCSSGYMLEDVLQAFPRATVYGSDFIANGLVYCHKTLPQIPLFQMDITDCKFPSAYFDAISCLNVLEHVAEDVAGIKELHRILKPGGLAVATVPVGPHLYDLYDEIHMHVRRYRLAELVDKFAKSGFNVIQSNHFGVAIYPAFYARKKLNQLLYGKKSLEEKKVMGMAQAHNSGRMKLFERLCDLEAAVGNHVRYPFGIRAFIVVQK